MEGQMSIFDVLEGGKSELKPLGKKNENNTDTLVKESNELIKCFKSELISVDYMNINDLFGGFNSIKAITFSYGLKFIDDIMNHFDNAEIILGSDMIVQKDSGIQELHAAVLANSYDAPKKIRSCKRLMVMMKNGDAEFRTPKFIMDHRKIYLLKADDGRTRVIKGSANMSGKAWNGNQMEHYEYDDTPKCYEEYIKDFETAWDNSEEITQEVVLAKKVDDMVECNAILKGVKEKEKVVVLKQIEDPVFIDNINYAITINNDKEKYKALLVGTGKAKNGMYEIVPKTVETIEFNIKKENQKKVIVRDRAEEYPKITFDYENQECYFNGEILNLNPSKEEVKHDIDEILGIYSNFDQFVGDIEKLKLSHFKLMNAIFSSPFNAEIRCAAKVRAISASSLPMFSLIASETANSGKTFMIRAALKLMTGKEINGIKACDFCKEKVRDAQTGCEGIPFFIDEINNKYCATISDIIKNPEKCEDCQIKTMPMLLFASNNVLKPDETLRKRMVFFQVDGALPSTIDKTAYESRGRAIIKKLSTGFYREYLRRMIEKVDNLIKFIIHSKDIKDEWYPDLMAISSDVIIQIFKDYGYELPPYIRHFTWKDDYCSDSNADDTIKEIGEFCKQNRKDSNVCRITKDTITIILGTDSKKRIESWKNMLPAEMKASLISLRNCFELSISRQALEERLGYKLGGIILFGKR